MEDEQKLTGAFPLGLKQPFKPSNSGLMPEMFSELDRIMQAKKKSRKLIRQSDLNWIVNQETGSRTAHMIDPREGFANSWVNFAFSQSAPGRKGKVVDAHKHTEAYIYIISGHGYTLYNPGTPEEEKVEFGPGDLEYVPPGVWHEHWITEPPLARIRILPGPLALNLLGIIASLNLSFDGALVQKRRGEDRQDYFVAYDERYRERERFMD